MTYITHWRPTIIHMRASRKAGRHSQAAQRLYKRQPNSAVVACDPILLPAWSESKIKVSEVTCKWCWHVRDEIQLCHLWCEIIFGFKVLTPGEPPILSEKASHSRAGGSGICVWSWASCSLWLNQTVSKQVVRHSDHPWWMFLWPCLQKKN